MPLPSIMYPLHIFPQTDECIRPAPSASGLRRKRQCGVPSSYEERQKKKKRADHGPALGGPQRQILTI
jgi:hypothetical protein